MMEQVTTSSIFLKLFLDDTEKSQDQHTSMEEKNKDQEFDESVYVAKLLDKVVSEDMVAFRELYDRYAGMLMSVIQSILHDQSESEDILQDVFLTIWNKANMYQSHLGKPTSWLVTIAKNKAYDKYRQIVRKSDGMAALKDEIQRPVIESRATADNEELAQGLGELNEDQKAAIELVFYQGLTQEEAAARLDAPLGTVKARIRRGLLKLKTILIKKN